MTATSILTWIAGLVWGSQVEAQAGERFYGPGRGDAGTAALKDRLLSYSIAEGEAVLAALRWYRENASDIEPTSEFWWRPDFRANFGR